jgi:hypothetical protein
VFPAESFGERGSNGESKHGTFVNVDDASNEEFDIFDDIEKDKLMF